MDKVGVEVGIQEEMKTEVGGGREGGEDGVGITSGDLSYESTR